MNLIDSTVNDTLLGVIESTNNPWLKMLIFFGLLYMVGSLATASSFLVYGTFYIIGFVKWIKDIIKQKLNGANKK